MPKGVNFPKPMIKRMVDMHFIGKKKFSEIGNIFSIHKGTVSKIIRRYKARGTISPIKRGGHARKTTPQLDRLIKRSAMTHPRWSASKILADVGHPNISRSTIKRRLTEFGLPARRPARKPYVSVKNRKLRVKFAQEHLNWTTDQWRKVLWSDESKFNLFSSDGIKYVRRPIGQRYNPKFMVPTVKHGGGSVMVWGCFSGYGMGPIHKIDGIMDRFVYKDILAEEMLPHGKENMPRGWIFQDDNDPKHRSHFVKDWIKSKKVKVMEWPAQSPDLNPIENLWDVVERRIRSENYANIHEFWNAIEKSWKSIPMTVIDRLIDSMKRRCEAVIKNFGYPTRY
jgi:transposase